MPKKLVFDTNIFISAIIFGGNPRRCLELSRNKEVVLYISEKLLLELTHKLHDKFEWNDEDIREVIIGICKFARIITPKIRITKIKKDPADNMVLEIAQEADADFIITGDKKHILPLKNFGRAKITTAADFLRNFKSNNPVAPSIILR